MLAVDQRHPKYQLFTCRLEVLGSRYAISGFMIISKFQLIFFGIRLVQIANDNRSFNFFDWNICGVDFDDNLLIVLFVGSLVSLEGGE